MPMPLPMPPKRTAPPLPSKAAVPKKSFSIAPWNGAGEGEKIILYADSGMGKTTLASMAPKPAFIGLDDGGRRIRNPKTGEAIAAFQDVSTFQDVRDILQQPSLFMGYDTVVIDTITALQDLAVPYLLTTIPTEKGGVAKNIVAYGYNKGYQHLYDVMKLILQDCDVLVKQGKNIIFIAQAGPHKVPNPAGEDYIRSGPRLYSGTPSVEALYCEWADHILLIDYQTTAVEKRKAVCDDNRAVFTKGQIHFRAKSRTLTSEQAVVSFTTPDDDSMWQFIFTATALT